MKPYRLKRKQNEQRKQNPARLKRRQILLECTRKIAIEDHKMEVKGIEKWYWGDYSPQFIFESNLYRDIYQQYNFQVHEIEMMWPIYQKCRTKLMKEHKKAEFIKKKFTPLEEDLFEIS